MSREATHFDCNKTYKVDGKEYKFNGIWFDSEGTAALALRDSNNKQHIEQWGADGHITLERDATLAMCGDSLRVKRTRKIYILSGVMYSPNGDCDVILKDDNGAIHKEDVRDIQYVTESQHSKSTVSGGARKGTRKGTRKAKKTRRS